MKQVMSSQPKSKKTTQTTTATAPYTDTILHQSNTHIRKASMTNIKKNIKKEKQFTIEERTQIYNDSGKTRSECQT